MKQFIVDRHTTPNTPTLEQVPTEKIPIYDDRAAVEADLANLTAGQIVATKDTGDELAQPVNVVEEGNLHAVSSNAVAVNCPRFPDYANRITIPNNATQWTATEDCYLMYVCTAQTNAVQIYLNNTAIGVNDNFGTSPVYQVVNFAGYIKKGDVVSCNSGILGSNRDICKVFKLK